jgi:hypothetical protein
MKLVHGNNFQTKCVQCGKDIVPELHRFAASNVVNNGGEDLYETTGKGTSKYMYVLR